ncbi:MAG: DUF485 domain-containing protein [Sphingobium phenoxybenzoativorans]|uniref:DUF485 domain-containing protein n=1 Tax=Sphingobium phenoxybenzoativorans TaxID=1592790 RepID=UPI000871CBEC|nr:DUF485 domain-containing protein [Sphingobium phenoxybenzoativorans]
MDEDMLARIEADPRYHRLTKARTRLAWLLTAIMLGAFFSFTALVAFNKELLAAPIGAGVTSLGIPIGFGLILLAILLTAIYVRQANGAFDRLTQEIIAGAEA